MAIITKEQHLVRKKPSQSAKDYIVKLKRGHGYRLDELSKDWGFSSETIKKHAREMNCLFYLKDSEGDWQEVVLHPDTAKEQT